MWTVGQLAKFCGVERTTIHARTKKIAWALSPEALPPKGKDRHYSARDVAIMIELDRLLKVDLSDEEIEASLRAAIRRNEFDDIDHFPEVIDPTEESVAMSQYQMDIARAAGKIEAAEKEAQMARAEADGLRVDKAKLEEAVKRLEEQITALNSLLRAAPETQERIAALREQLAEARTRLASHTSETERLEARAYEKEQSLQEKEAEIQRLQNRLGQADNAVLWLNDQNQKLQQQLDEERSKKKGFFRR